MKDKIDAVVLFVDMNDEQWRNRYNDFVKTHEIPNKYINNETRFRDYGSLRGVLRSIDKYAPWINNVFLVVESESQVPKWVNRETVKVVLHEEFIPKEYLPTFNCNTIETHLHFIPGLSEKFIYFNDDMLLIDINYPEDYFIGDKCVHYMNKKDVNGVLKSTKQIFYRKLRFSNILTLHNLFNKIKMEHVYYNSHGPTPMLKTLCNEIYDKIDIKSHMTPFREYTNLTQELFTFYSLYKRKLILLENSIKHNECSHATIRNMEVEKYLPENHEKFINIFLGKRKKTFCVNDVFDDCDTDIDLYDEIKKIIEKRFPLLSKYENETSIRVAVCAIGKWEEQYLPEWVEHYKSIGFDNVLFYDNNDEGNNSQYEALKPYIDEGFVIYHDWIGKVGDKVQKKSYNNCLNEYKQVYDWIAFFDCDEFLELFEYENIKTFISNNTIFNNFCGISFSSILIKDNNIIYNDRRLLKERFPFVEGNKKNTNTIKTIVNTHKLEKKEKICCCSVHVPFCRKNTCANVDGVIMNNSEKNNKTNNPIFNRGGVILHYKTKTIEEYTKKILRGDINYRKLEDNKELNDIELRIKWACRSFFKNNQLTQEKINFFINHINSYEIDCKDLIKNIKKKYCKHL